MGEPSSRNDLPASTVGDLLEAAIVARRMRDGAIEEHPLPRNPLDVVAQQIVAPRRDPWRAPVDELARDDAPDRQLRRPLRGSGSATRSTSSGRPATRRSAFAVAAAVGRLEPCATHRAAGEGRKRVAVTSRRDDPRPWTVRRVPTRRCACRRARRGDGVREPARGDVRARRVDLADRGHHVPTGHRHSGAGRARQDAVLARRPAGPPARTGSGRRRIRSRAAHPRPRTGHRDAARRYPLDPLAANLLQYVDEQAEATGVVPTTAPSSSSGSATRSATGASAC